MKKIISLFVFSFILALGVAQENLIMVLSSRGNASYAMEDGGEAIEIIPGLSIPVEGNIFLADEARVRLIIQKKSFLLNGPGRYKVSELYDPNAKKSMGFSARFWNFVMEGMGSTKDQKELTKYHREYMKVHGGVKGFAEADSSLRLISPAPGKISENGVLFKWKSASYEGSFIFSISDAARHELYSTNTRLTDHSIDLAMIDIKAGNKYFWSVAGDTQEGGLYAESEFLYLPEDLSLIKERLLYLEDFDKADPEEKKWMKAVALEMEEHYYEAEQLYKSMIDLDPENLFLQKSFALFLCRQNRYPEARAILDN